MTKVFKKLNRKIAPILLFPLLITSITGIILGLRIRFEFLPQVIVNALVVIHQGLFLGEKLAPFYVLALGLGVLTISLTILIKLRDDLIFKQAKSGIAKIYNALALIIFFSSAVCVETGVAYRLGTDWLNMTDEQTKIFWSFHTGSSLSIILGIIYTLVTGFGLILLPIMGVKARKVSKISSDKKLQSPLSSVQKKSKPSLPLSNSLSLLLLKKIHKAIIIFSLIFMGIIGIISVVTLAILPSIVAILSSIVIVLIVFTIPAWLIANRLNRDFEQSIKDWQQQVKTEYRNLETDSNTSSDINKAFPDAMLQIDENGKCLDYTPAIEAKSFLIKGEIINRHLSELLDAKIALQFIKSTRLALEFGSVHSNRFAMVAENGGRQYYEARFSPIGNIKVLVIIRQLSDYDGASNPEETSLLSEPQLTEILETTLNKTALGDRHHMLCYFVVSQQIITISIGTEPDSEPQNSNPSEDLLFVADKIKSNLSPNCIARLNDSELIALILDCSRDRASELINKLQSELNNFSLHEKREYPINVSIKLIQIDANSPNATDLINMAKAYRQTKSS